MANRNQQHIIGKQTQNVAYGQPALGTARTAYAANKGSNLGGGFGHGFMSFTPKTKANPHEIEAMRTHSYGSVIGQTRKPNMANVAGWQKWAGSPSGFAPVVKFDNGKSMIHKAWQQGGTQHKDFRADSWRPGGQPLRQWTVDPDQYGDKTVGNVTHQGWSWQNQGNSYNHPSSRPPIQNDRFQSPHEARSAHSTQRAGATYQNGGGEILHVGSNQPYAGGTAQTFTDGQGINRVIGSGRPTNGVAMRTYQGADGVIRVVGTGAPYAGGSAQTFTDGQGVLRYIGTGTPRG